MIRILITSMLLWVLALPVFSVTVTLETEIETTWVGAYGDATVNYSTSAITEMSSSEDDFPSNSLGIKVTLDKADLSGIPAGSNIDSVIAIWQAGNNFSDTVSYMAVTTITKDYIMSEVTWNEISTGVNWGGGDFRAVGSRNWGTHWDSAEIRTVHANAYFTYSGDGEGLCESFQSELDGGTFGRVWFTHNTITATATFQTENHATPAERPSYEIWYTPPGCDGTPTDLVDTVSANTDDAGYFRVDSPCAWAHNRATIVFGNDFNDVAIDCLMKGGIRYADVEIPQGSVVCSAKLSFRPSISGSVGTVLVRWYVEDEADALTWSTDNWTSRNLTSSSVLWDLGSWTSGVYEDTPDLTLPVQEVINRGDWSSGNAMMFLYEDGGTAGGLDRLRSATSRDASTTLCAILTIEYIPPESTGAPQVIMIMGS